jgi:hypothetical protein
LCKVNTGFEKFPVGNFYLPVIPAKAGIQSFVTH